MPSLIWQHLCCIVCLAADMTGYICVVPSTFTIGHNIINCDSDSLARDGNVQGVISLELLVWINHKFQSQTMCKGRQGEPAFIYCVACGEAWRSEPTSSSMSHDCLIAWQSVGAHTLKALREMEIWKSKEGIKEQQTVKRIICCTRFAFYQHGYINKGETEKKTRL